MTIKIVTDSTADLPQALAEELGITVVPLCDLPPVAVPVVTSLFQ